MAIKQSESSQHAQLQRVNSRDISLSSDDLAKLNEMAARQSAGDESQIDLSDIPEMTADELAALRPARDFEPFRRWQDQHFLPEHIAKFEAALRR